LVETAPPTPPRTTRSYSLQQSAHKPFNINGAKSVKFQQISMTRWNRFGITGRRFESSLPDLRNSIVSTFSSLPAVISAIDYQFRLTGSASSSFRTARVSQARVNPVFADIRLDERLPATVCGQTSRTSRPIRPQRPNYFVAMFVAGTPAAAFSIRDATESG
jgi:hypothetical protein